MLIVCLKIHVTLVVLIRILDYVGTLIQVEAIVPAVIQDSTPMKLGESGFTIAQVRQPPQH